MRISDWSSDVCSSDLSKRSAWLSWIQALNQILQCLFVNLLAAFVCGFTVIRSIVSVRLVKILYEKRLIFIIPPRASRESLTRASANKTPSFASSRSEEHTSELQSLMRISYAVFCLKKTRRT